MFSSKSYFNSVLLMTVWLLKMHEYLSVILLHDIYIYIYINVGLKLSTLLKSFGPSQTDKEIQLLSESVQVSAFLRFILKNLKEGADFELMESYLALYLKVLENSLFSITVVYIFLHYNNYSTTVQIICLLTVSNCCQKFWVYTTICGMSCRKSSTLSRVCSPTQNILQFINYYCNKLLFYNNNFIVIIAIVNLLF